MASMSPYRESSPVEGDVASDSASDSTHSSSSRRSKRVKTSSPTLSTASGSTRPTAASRNATPNPPTHATANHHPTTTTTNANANNTPADEAADHEILNGMSEVSDDSDGDVPNSPTHLRFDDDDHHEQVSACAWEGCEVGDLGNMDRLVEHIHFEHIEGRARKYTCEWVGCTRKSMGHASAYALRAHMRSHTREKPFYCYLPECDRAFTRSDALAKHMRTVHQIDELKIAETARAAAMNKSTRPKIIIRNQKALQVEDDGPEEEIVRPDFFTVLPEEEFTDEEVAMPVEKLYHLCRHQLQWTEEERTRLQEEISQSEEEYLAMWKDKEVLLSQVIDSELAWSDRRDAIVSGAVDVKIVKDDVSGALAHQVETIS